VVFDEGGMSTGRGHAKGHIWSTGDLSTTRSDVYCNDTKSVSCGSSTGPYYYPLSPLGFSLGEVDNSLGS
jgi:hypothetical protein